MMGAATMGTDDATARGVKALVNDTASGIWGTGAGIPDRGCMCIGTGDAAMAGLCVSSRSTRGLEPLELVKMTCST